MKWAIIPEEGFLSYKLFLIHNPHPTGRGCAVARGRAFIIKGSELNAGAMIIVVI